MDRLTPARRWALGFFVLAAGCVVVWITTNAADDWMPSAATAAVGIGLTITLVEWIVDRDRRERGSGRRTAAYERLEDAFIDLNSALTFDTRGRAEPGDDPIDLIEEWLSTADDVTHYPGGEGEPAVIRGIRYFALRMGRVLDEDRDVLPNELRAAMVEVRERIASTDQAYAATVRPHTLAFHLMLARSVLEAVLEVAKQLRRERGNEWMAALRRLVRIEMRTDA